MSKVIQFKTVTIKSILREAVKEVNKMYLLTKGGQDWLVSTDLEEREMFDNGLVEEMTLLSWEVWCKKKLEDL